jgi:hypothetical protein
VETAATLLGRARLRNRYAVATDGRLDTPLPVR